MKLEAIAVLALAVGPALARNETRRKKFALRMSSREEKVSAWRLAAAPAQHPRRPRTR